MMTLIRKARAELGALLRFGIVGLGATALHLTVAETALLSGIAGPYVANLAGFLSAVAASYFGHFYFTFRVAASHRTALQRFLPLALAAFCASNALLWRVMQWGAVGPLGLAVAVLLIPAFTFLASRFWAFRA